MFRALFPSGLQTYSVTRIIQRLIHKMAPIVLYKTDASPPSNVVRMIADILGLPLEFKDIDFPALDHKAPDYIKINPIGTVPTIIDGDFVLSDSHAITKYLLSKYGADKSESLYPSDVRTRALIDQALFFDTGVFFIKLKLVALPSIFGDMTEPTEQIRKEIDDCYQVLETFLEKRKFIATDHLTIADVSLGATTAAMQPIHELDAKKFPRTVDWLSRLEKESFFKKIMVPGAELLRQGLNACWERNKQKKN